MVDGKVINILEDNDASSKCFMFPKDLNNLNYCDCNNSTLQYGLSPLHARLRFFDFFLKNSYRLSLPNELKKKGSHMSNEHKELVNERKRFVQEQFRKRLGILIDIPKNGYGTSNDGNTARTFFENYAISSDITGIDENILKRVYIILTCINTSEEINATEFKKYAFDTAKLIISMYGWWTMSPTVHKVLIHGSEIIQNSVLPVGQLSEESLERSHKYFKIYKSNFSRKNSRINNLKDIFQKFMVESDPKISILREETSNFVKNVPYPKELLQLIQKN